MGHDELLRVTTPIIETKQMWTKRIIGNVFGYWINSTNEATFEFLKFPDPYDDFSPVASATQASENHRTRWSFKRNLGRNWSINRVCNEIRIL